MPLASMSNVTSICGWPRGMGGMPSRLNLPSRLLAYVEKVWDFFAGTVVLRLMRAVMTPPAVSRPRDRGVTSKRSKSDSFSEESEPDKMAACTVAPYATASSGLMDLQGSLPLKKSANNDWILGIRVDPPTSTTSLTWDLLNFASLITFSTGSMHLRK